MNTEFTVLLARPDSIANDNTDTLLLWVLAINPVAALALARAEACEVDGYVASEDYACLILIAGRHNDDNPEL